MIPRTAERWAATGACGLGAVRPTMSQVERAGWTAAQFHHLQPTQLPRDLPPSQFEHAGMGHEPCGFLSAAE